MLFIKFRGKKIKIASGGGISIIFYLFVSGFLLKFSDDILDGDLPINKQIGVFLQIMNTGFISLLSAKDALVFTFTLGIIIGVGMTKKIDTVISWISVFFFLLFIFFYRQFEFAEMQFLCLIVLQNMLQNFSQSVMVSMLKHVHSFLPFP